jgi:ABC-2 type transport system permease protein
MCGTIAAVPLRALISVPFALVMLFAIEGPAGATIARDPLGITLFVVSLAQAFLLSFEFSALVGALALYFDSALVVWSIYIGMFSLLSGYLLPLALFPAWLRRVAAATPFPYLQALPVELLLGRHPVGEAMRQIALQLVWVLGSWTVLLLFWRKAQRRFAAYGG